MSYVGTFNLVDRDQYKVLFHSTNRFRGMPALVGKVICTYAITAETTGLAYVGSTENFFRRWNDHLIALRQGTHANVALQAVANKIGIEELQIKILQRYDSTDDLLTHERRDGRAHYREHDLLNVRLGSKYINGLSPTAMHYLNPRGRKATMRPGLQTKSRWYHGQATA